MAWLRARRSLRWIAGTFEARAGGKEKTKPMKKHAAMPAGGGRNQCDDRNDRQAILLLCAFSTICATKWWNTRHICDTTMSHCSLRLCLFSRREERTSTWHFTAWALLLPLYLPTFCCGRLFYNIFHYGDSCADMGYSRCFRAVPPPPFYSHCYHSLVAPTVTLPLLRRLHFLASPSISGIGADLTGPHAQRDLLPFVHSMGPTARSAIDGGRWLAANHGALNLRGLKGSVQPLFNQQLFSKPS